MSLLLKPFSFAFKQATNVRRFIYKKYSAPQKFPVKIISVGNVTVGGTGKTPFVDFLCKRIKKRKVVILSRGYKRKSKGFYKVDSSKENASSLYGDEPLMLALKNPDVNLYVCEDRAVGVQKILNAQDVDVIILDDALQNFSIAKDIEFVIIDSTEKLENYKFLPEGRARSSLEAIDLSQIVVFTKTDLADEKVLLLLERKFEAHRRIKMVYSKPYLQHYSTGKNLVGHETVYLMSGIGKPGNFESLVLDKLNLKIGKHFVFEDHHYYSQGEVDKISKEIGTQPLLVTEKDYAKLQYLKHQLNIFVVGAEFEIIEGSEILDDILKLESVQL